MSFEIVGRPEFYFTLDAKTVEVLMVLSSLHYDGACRQASAVGGFIHNWKYTLELSNDSTCWAKFWELDLVLKICEFGPPKAAREDWPLALTFCDRIREALKVANEKAAEWKVVL